MNDEKRENLKIAVIGSGISGITASYLLDRKHNVTLFEKNDYFGGHTNTVVIQQGPDEGTPVDTGFIVLNEKTYPNFIKFLKDLNVTKRQTDMSFGYHNKKTGLSYATRSLNAIFAQRKNIFNVKYLRFVYEMVKFLKVIRDDYLNGELPDITLSDHIIKNGFHKELENHFVIPMAAAIWSGSYRKMGNFPVRTFAQFYENHGLLSVTDHPPWYYIEGGSRSYVEAFLKIFRGKTIKNSKIIKVRREKDHNTILFEDREPETFDSVIIATHADQALNLLEEPTDEERKLLGVWGYSKNRTILHTDNSLMPESKRAWASWNYRRGYHAGDDTPATLTYDMVRLQKLETELGYFVSLNPEEKIKKESIIRELVYTHPQYSFEAFKSQEYLNDLNGIKNTYFCGSYFGYGFHEDGVKSAVNVGKKFGAEL